MILTTTFLCFCLASAINYFRTRRQRSYIKNLGGPFTWPLLGAMHKFLFLKPQNFFQRSHAYLVKYGSVTRLWVFHRLFMPLADLELAKQVLQSEQHLETGYELMHHWLAGGVLMCEKEQWAQRHSLIRGIFEKGNMLPLTELCRQQAVLLQLKLADRAEQREVFNAWEIVAPAVRDLMVQTTCGLRPSEEYAKAFNGLTEIYRKRFLSLQSVNRFSFWISSPLMRRRQLKLIKRLNAEHKEHIERFRKQQKQEEQLKAGNLSLDHIEPLPPQWHQSLLEVLLAPNHTPVISDDDICAELNTCNYLGYLLCSSALCFALVTIARHPAVQQRCLEELRKAQRPDQSWDVKRLTYLEAVLMETLRLYPPQVIVGRQLSEDMPYTHSVVGDGTLPFGAEIYVNLFEMQRDEERYLHASHFRAERFLESPPELLSFSMGPRCCPARQFSMVMLKTLLAPIISSFELLPHGDAPRLDLRLALGSSNGFQLALTPRFQ
ncbi:probable cytochrome P450 316a1 [Drosophila subobscura]|uniref:probable cytochrome P450 316a1 n=1 Tax=Drosophila subobscura TaxID=7241 RepID=UPI00155ACBC1|nr:probable cytochrome P450 316a1 [Drosophila subobscura]